MGFSERLEEIIEERGISKYKIAKAIDISASTIGNYVKGKTKPDPTKLSVLSKLLGVSKNWLQTGEGIKYLTEEPEIPSQQVTAGPNDKLVIERLLNLLDKQHDSLREKDMQITQLIRKIPDVPSQN